MKLLMFATAGRSGVVGFPGEAPERRPWAVPRADEEQATAPEVHPSTNPGPTARAPQERQAAGDHRASSIPGVSLRPSAAPAIAPYAHRLAGATRLSLLLFTAAGFLAAAPSVRIDPPVITSCQGGSGQATVFWDSEGATPVTLYAGESAMSGPESATGSARTGVWVTDGMVFSLRNAAGETIATATASLRCSAGAWWPLDPGNEWHFRRNDRIVTGAHSVWRILRKERIGDVDWSVLQRSAGSTLEHLRSDPDGRIYRLAADGRETLLLDPTGGDGAAWTVTGRAPSAVTLAGTFGEEVSWRGPVVGLGRESGRFARGVGPTYYQTDVIAGSSGGFGDGLTLLEAVVGGARCVPNYPRLELVLESKNVNFGTKSARNCAIPCYFVACFLADLPTTYKPCMEVSLRGGPGRVALLDPSGTPVFESPADGWVRIPLYRNPATLLSPGTYTVQATAGATTIALPLEIQ